MWCGMGGWWSVWGKEGEGGQGCGLRLGISSEGAAGDGVMKRLSYKERDISNALWPDDSLTFMSRSNSIAD